MTSKRPIPTLKKDNELDNFINEICTIPSKKHQIMQKVIKKSLTLSENVDNNLRIESAKTRETQNEIIEQAIIEYLRKKGYEDI